MQLAAKRAHGRLIVCVVVGFLVFNLLAFLVASSIGAVWPAFDAIENPRDYTAPMLWFRLAMGAVALLVSGLIAGLISRRGRFAGLILGVVFDIFFLPIHLFVLFEDFPIWYHAIFLIYVIPVTWLGGRLAGNGRPLALTLEQTAKTHARDG